jgi:hypothetical protein
MTLAEQLDDLEVQKWQLARHLGESCVNENTKDDLRKLIASLDQRIQKLKAPAQSPARKFGHWHSGDMQCIWIEGAKSERMIDGIASTPTVNSHKYSLASAGCHIRLPVPLLSSHKGHSTPIGEVVHVRKCPLQIYVRAIVHHGPAGDYAWEMIESGELRAFSGAAVQESWKLDGIVDGVSFYKNWTLREVSICREGANPDCWFDIYKAGDDASALAKAGKSGAALVTPYSPIPITVA